MGWTAQPKSTIGDMIDSAFLNTHWRDNLDHADQHGHSGADGDGAAILPSLDRIDFDHQGALSEPAADHTRAAMNADGTFRWRMNGGSEKTASVEGHTHS